MRENTEKDLTFQYDLYIIDTGIIKYLAGILLNSTLVKRTNTNNIASVIKISKIENPVKDFLKKDAMDKLAEMSIKTAEKIGVKI